MENREVVITIEADVTKWMRSMKRAAEAAMKIVRRAHILFHQLNPDPRCAVCHPIANPRPLCIDGNEYARRRRGRRRA